MPPNKSLKVRLFDDWHATFYVKMFQAKLADILQEGYTKSEQSDEDYEQYKTKDDFLKNHLLTAMIGSIAIAFITVQTMYVLEMYNRLLDVFQGQEHDEDKAVNTASLFENLKFNRRSWYTSETVLAKVNKCLKKIEVHDVNGGTTTPVSDVLLPIFPRKDRSPNV